MRFDAGSTNLTSAGTAQKIVDRDLQIVFIAIKAKPGNTNDLYFGRASVSATNGWTLKPGDETSLDFDPSGKGTSVSFQDLHFNGATTNDDIEWMVLYKQ